MAPTARTAAAALVLLAAGVAAQQDAGAGGVPGDPGPPEPGSDEGGVPNGGKPPSGYRGMGSPQGGPPFNGPPGVGDGPPQGPPQGPGVGGGGGMMPRRPNHPPSTLRTGMTRPLPLRGKDLGKPKPPPKPRHHDTDVEPDNEPHIHKPGKKAPWVQREVIVTDLVFQWDPRTKDIDAKVAQPTAVQMNRCVHTPRIALHCRPRCVAIATNTPHRAGGSLPGATNAVSAARAMRRTVRRNLRLPRSACSHKRC